MAKERTEFTDQPNEITRIPKGTTVDCGTMKCSNSLRLDGRFSGNVIAGGKAIVGEESLLKGNLICSCADIYGVVDGSIIANDMIMMMSNSKVTGNIFCQKLNVDGGVSFNGQFKIISDEEFLAMLAEKDGKEESQDKKANKQIKSTLI